MSSMVPIKQAKRLARDYAKGRIQSRHDKLVLGLMFRHERLRRILPGGMYNPDGDVKFSPRIEWQQRRIAATEARERKLYAEMMQREHP